MGWSITLIIHPHIPKRKKRKPNAQQRELKASWEAILKKYETKTTIQRTSRVVKDYVPPVVLRRECALDNAPSLDSGLGTTPMRESPRYTGDAMIGISSTHKSNDIPIFSKDHILDISKMRK